MTDLASCQRIFNIRPWRGCEASTAEGGDGDSRRRSDLQKRHREQTTATHQVTLWTQGSLMGAVSVRWLLVAPMGQQPPNSEKSRELPSKRYHLASWTQWENLYTLFIYEPNSGGFIINRDDILQITFLGWRWQGQMSAQWPGMWALEPGCLGSIQGSALPSYATEV